MKKILIIIAAVVSIFLVTESIKIGSIKADSGEQPAREISKEYKFPETYRGIYLNVASANNFEKLSVFVDKAKKSNINAFVLDVQAANFRRAMVPAKNVEYCIANGIHPIARVVVFPDGLKNYPVTNEYIQTRLDIAEDACKNGFREIQFDYIRFNDSSALKHLTLTERYNFIEGFLAKARTRLSKYNTKIAADIFGRIPLNSSDLIGQRMEGLDKVVDIICPMAYPSHYTWSKKLMNDPYTTVLITSQKAEERTKNAEIVTYIQAFRMKLGSMPFQKYMEEQLRAIDDSGIKGFIWWNAPQVYDEAFLVTKEFYEKKVSRKETTREKIKS